MVLFAGVPGLQSPTLQGGFPIQNLQAALQSAGATVATPTSQGEYFFVQNFSTWDTVTHCALFCV